MTVNVSHKTTDAKGRVTLGGHFANRAVIVEQHGDDAVVVRLARVIPEREAWLHDNPILILRIGYTYWIPAFETVTKPDNIGTRVRANTNTVILAKARIQAVTYPEGQNDLVFLKNPYLRCFAWCNELGSSLRWNDGYGLESSASKSKGSFVTASFAGMTMLVLGLECSMPLFQMSR